MWGSSGLRIRTVRVCMTCYTPRPKNTRILGARAGHGYAVARARRRRRRRDGAHRLESSIEYAKVKVRRTMEAGGVYRGAGPQWRGPGR